MAEIAYTVACTFTDPAVGQAWANWLRDGHLADVCAAGALDAQAVAMDAPAVGMNAPAIRYEARYRFASRAAFEAYERGITLRSCGPKGWRNFPSSWASPMSGASERSSVATPGIDRAPRRLLTR